MFPYDDKLPVNPIELQQLTAAQRALMTSGGSNVQVALFEASFPMPQFFRMTLAELLSLVALASPTLTGVVTLGGSDTLTGAGAVSVTAAHTELVTTGANALTLANGGDGQVKVISMKTNGGDGTLTPTTKTGFSTITFTAVGQTATLIYKTGSGWIILAVNGATVA